MGSETNFDLTGAYTDDYGREMTYENYTHWSYIDWEGTILEARLYTHPVIKEFVQNSIW